MEPTVKFDQQHSALERLLGDEACLDVLTSGKKEQEKTALVTTLVSEIGEDMPSQEDLLKALIETLAKGGDSSEDTTRRDAALAILANEVLADILKIHIHAVYVAYLNAVRTQTNAHDPYGGSIYGLLEAGKTIAPFFPKSMRVVARPISNAWKGVAEQFTTDSGKRKHIISESDAIWEIIEPIADAQQGRKRGKGKKTQQFDDQVEPLLQQGLSNAEIALQLKITQPPVRASVRRLRRQGRVLPRKPGPKPKNEDFPK